ncbi:MAG TPA: APC family permease [Streptosporangiaceae bacterium]|nr:APC family permease [Streptosporangiaceae bacterium]
MAATKTSTEPVKLHRNLSVAEAIGISLALMAPSMAASINPQGTASTIGRAVPLAFAIAFVGVLLVAYTFVRLTQRFHHSGSVYGFVGATLGPQAGVIAGWALTGTYTFYAVVTSMAGGRFAAGFLDSTGVWRNQPAWAGFLLGAAGLALVWWLAITPARGGTRVLLAAEGITVLLIVIVIVTVFAKLLGHAGPGKLGVDWSVFSVPAGTPITAVFLGVVFGFLSFAGFEAASTLGEETRQPRRDIPRAILGVAIFGGIYFVVVTAVEAMAFGTSKAGVAAFINSPSLIGDLGSRYVSSWIGNIITLGAMVSAFSCALACCVGAARLSYALGRDGMLPRRLARVAPGRRTPTVSTGAVVLGAYVIIAFTWFALRGDPFGLFVQAGVIGTLILLVVYVMATIGMMKLVFFSGGASTGAGSERGVRSWEIIVPVLAIVVLGYTLFRNVWPLPQGAGWWGPGTAIAWIVTGIILALAQPSATARAGEMLLRSEGLAPMPKAGDAKGLPGAD